LVNVTGDSKSALQLINDHSSKNFEDFQRVNDSSFRNELTQSQLSSTQEARKEPLQNSACKQFKLFGWGLNDQHQLGQLGFQTLESIQTSPRSSQPQTNSRQMIMFPRELKELDHQVKQVACGEAHSLILTTTNQVFALGENSHGQLGLPVCSNAILSFPTRAVLKLPEELLSGKVNYEISQVATSPGDDSHSLILVTSDHRQLLLGSGLNSHG